MVTPLKHQGIAYAKTTRPILGNFVRRESLFARLDQSPGWTVAWISGPAGAGKSTLAASYIESRKLPSIWYQIDADDADVATFFHYLAHAARRFEGSKSSSLSAFTPQQAKDVPGYARRFFRALFMRTKIPAALVLDNLNEVSASTALYAAIEAGLSQVPNHCRVFITSRAEPPAALARMRMSGGLLHLGWDALRLGKNEIAEIARLRGQFLSDDEVAKLDQRTQGWAAGLVLMLEHAKISGRIAELPGDPAPTVMFDYLAGEIFSRFDTKIQQFLLRIACMPRMTAHAAASLSRDESAERILLNMVRNDYFVRETPGDGERIFQLHPLLRDFLRSRVAHDLPEAAGKAAIRHAAHCLHEAGLLDDAVMLLAETRDWEEAARIVAAAAQDMLVQDRAETLRSWLELLPAQLIAADPRLLCAHAESRMHTSTRLARRQYAEAYETYRRAGDKTGMIHAARGVISAIILEFDDLTLLDEWTARLANLIEEPGHGTHPAATASLARALLLRAPGSDTASLIDRAEMAERAQTSSEKDAPAATELALARAMHALLRGGTFSHAPDVADSDTAIALCVASAMDAMTSGSMHDAIGIVRRGRDLANSADNHVYDTWLRMLAAASALGSGDRDTARGELAGIESPDVPLRRGDQALNHYLRGWLGVVENDAARTAREGRTALALADELGMPWLACLARIAVAQTASAEGDHRGADALLRAAHEIADLTQNPMLRAAARLALAGVELAAGDKGSPPALLRAGLQIAREHGLRSIAVLRPEWLGEICAAAMRSGVEADYASTLARTAKLAPPPSATRLKLWPRPFQICMLGGFSLLKDGAAIEFSGKGPGRPVELLKVLVALGSLGTQGVRSEQIADALWPRVDADYAHKSFTIALHRLRRLLDEDDALILRDGRLNLNSRLIWLDTWALDQLLSEINNELRQPRPHPDPALRTLIDESLEIYRGPLLPDESEQPSYIGCREQIRARLLRTLTRVTRGWEQTGAYEAAEDSYLRLIDADPLFETAHRALMQHYQRRGQLGEMRAAYERLRVTLATRLKIAPSAETEALLQATH